MVLSKGGIDYATALDMHESELWAHYIAMIEASAVPGARWDWQKWDLAVPKQPKPPKVKRNVVSPTLPGIA